MMKIISKLEKISLSTIMINNIFGMNNKILYQLILNKNQSENQSENNENTLNVSKIVDKKKHSSKYK